LVHKEHLEVLHIPVAVRHVKWEVNNAHSGGARDIEGGVQDRRAGSAPELTVKCC
jgi:hypothetical protein